MADQQKPDRTIIWAMTAIAMTAMTCCTVLVMTGKAIGDLLAVLAVAAVPVLSYFGAQIHGVVQQTKELANGNLTATRDAMIRMAEQLGNIQTAGKDASDD